MIGKITKRLGSAAISAALVAVALVTGAAPSNAVSIVSNSMCQWDPNKNLGICVQWTLNGNTRVSWLGSLTDTSTGEKFLCIDYMYDANLRSYTKKSTLGLVNQHGAVVDPASVKALSAAISHYAPNGSSGSATTDAALSMIIREVMGDGYRDDIGATVFPKITVGGNTTVATPGFGSPSSSVMTTANTIWSWMRSHYGDYTVSVTGLPSTLAPSTNYVVTATVKSATGTGMSGFPLAFTLTGGTLVSGTTTGNTSSTGQRSITVKTGAGGTTLSVKAVATSLPGVYANLAVPSGWTTNSGGTSSSNTPQRGLISTSSSTSAAITASSPVVVTYGYAQAKKVDSVTGAVLAGAKFTAFVDTNADGVKQSTEPYADTTDTATMQTLTTATTGLTPVVKTSDGLRVCFVETAAPAGYAVSTAAACVAASKTVTAPAVVTVKDTKLPGYLVIKKSDAISGAVLAGAVFTAWNDTNADKLVSSGEKVYSTTLTSGTNGLTAVVTTVAVGDLVCVKETKSPTNYTLGTAVVCAKSGASSSAPTVLPYTNSKVGGYAQAKKVDSVTGAVLAGAVFTAWLDSNANGVQDTGETVYSTSLATASTGLTAVVVTADFGQRVCFKESKAPTNYAVNATVTCVASTTTLSAPGTVTVKDTKLKGTVAVKKVDATDPTLVLAGAQFTAWVDTNPNGVQDTGETVLGTALTTGTSGQIAPLTVDMGTRVCFKETAAPTGYTLSSKPVCGVASTPTAVVTKTDVARYSPALNTTVSSTSPAVGDTVTDTVVGDGYAPNEVTAVAWAVHDITGQSAPYVCDATNLVKSGTSPVTADANGAFTLTGIGGYSVTVADQGKTYTYVDGSASSTTTDAFTDDCGLPNETFSVKYTPALNTNVTATAPKAGNVVSDTITGSGYPADSTVTGVWAVHDITGQSAPFVCDSTNVVDSGTFTTTSAADGTITVTGVGPQTVVAGKTLTYVDASDATTLSLAATHDCGLPSETFAGVKYTPALNTNVTATAPKVGDVVSDTITGSGYPANTDVTGVWAVHDISGQSAPYTCDSTNLVDSGVFSTTSAADGTITVTGVGPQTVVDGKTLTYVDASDATDLADAATHDCGLPSETFAGQQYAGSFVTKVSADSAMAGDSGSDTITGSGYQPGSTVTGTWSVFGPEADPAAPTCATAVDGGTGTWTATADDQGKFTVTVGPVAFLNPGAYAWVDASDASTANVAYSGHCGETGETVTVKPYTGSFVTKVSADTAMVGDTGSDTITGSGYQPGSTVTGVWSVYDTDQTNPTCEQSELVGSGEWTTTADDQGNIEVTVGPVTFPKAGFYSWVDSSLRTGTTNAYSGQCGETGETVVVKPYTGKLVTHVTAQKVEVGSAVKDVVIGSGFAPGAKVTGVWAIFDIGDGTAPSCSAKNQVATGTFDATADDSGAFEVTTGEWKPTKNGVYTYVESTDAGAFNAAVTHDCGVSAETFAASPKSSGGGGIDSGQVILGSSPWLASGIVVIVFAGLVGLVGAVRRRKDERV